MCLSSQERTILNNFRYIEVPHKNPDNVTVALPSGNEIYIPRTNFDSVVSLYGGEEGARNAFAAAVDGSLEFVEQSTPGQDTAKLTKNFGPIVGGLLELPSIYDAFQNEGSAGLIREIADLAAALVGGAAIGAVAASVGATGDAAVLAIAGFSFLLGPPFGNLFEGLNNAFFNPPHSPLVLDLDGDGIELTSIQDASVYFDVDVKPHKVVIIAVARKLVTIVNALCKSRQNWTVQTV